MHYRIYGYQRGNTPQASGDSPRNDSTPGVPQAVGATFLARGEAFLAERANRALAGVAQAADSIRTDQQVWHPAHKWGADYAMAFEEDISDGDGDTTEVQLEGWTFVGEYGADSTPRAHTAALLGGDLFFHDDGTPGYIERFKDSAGVAFVDDGDTHVHPAQSGVSVSSNNLYSVTLDGAFDWEAYPVVPGLYCKINNSRSWGGNYLVTDAHGSLLILAHKRHRLRVSGVANLADIDTDDELQFGALRAHVWDVYLVADGLGTFHGWVEFLPAEEQAGNHERDDWSAAVGSTIDTALIGSVATVDSYEKPDDRLLLGDVSALTVDIVPPPGFYLHPCAYFPALYPLPDPGVGNPDNEFLILYRALYPYWGTNASPYGTTDWGSLLRDRLDGVMKFNFDDVLWNTVVGPAGTLIPPTKVVVSVKAGDHLQYQVAVRDVTDTYFPWQIDEDGDMTWDANAGETGWAFFDDGDLKLGVDSVDAPPAATKSVAFKDSRLAAYVPVGGVMTPGTGDDVTALDESLPQNLIGAINANKTAITVGPGGQYTKLSDAISDVAGYASARDYYFLVVGQTDTEVATITVPFDGLTVVGLPGKAYIPFSAAAGPLFDIDGHDCCEFSNFTAAFVGAGGAPPVGQTRTVVADTGTADSVRRLTIRNLTTSVAAGPPAGRWSGLFLLNGNAGATEYRYLEVIGCRTTIGVSDFWGYACKVFSAKIAGNNHLSATTPSAGARTRLLEIGGVAGTITDSVKVEGNHFIGDSTTSHGEGIFLSVNGARVSGNVVRYTLGAGIYLDSASGCTLSSNRIDDACRGDLPSGLSGYDEMGDASVYTNAAIVLAGCEEGTLRDNRVTISETTFTGGVGDTGVAGLLLIDVTDVHVVDNTLPTGWGTQVAAVLDLATGIRVISTDYVSGDFSSQVTIRGNTVYLLQKDSGSESASVVSGVYVSGVDVHVSDNNILLDYEGNNPEFYIYFVHLDVLSDGCIVADNGLRAFSSNAIPGSPAPGRIAGVYGEAAATGEVVVRGNRFGIYDNAGSTITIDDAVIYGYRLGHDRASVEGNFVYVGGGEDTQVLGIDVTGDYARIHGNHVEVGETTDSGVHTDVNFCIRANGALQSIVSDNVLLTGGGSGTNDCFIRVYGTADRTVVSGNTGTSVSSITSCLRVEGSSAEVVVDGNSLSVDGTVSDAGIWVSGPKTTVTGNTVTATAVTDGGGTASAIKVTGSSVCAVGHNTVTSAGVLDVGINIDADSATVTGNSLYAASIASDGIDVDADNVVVGSNVIHTTGNTVRGISAGGTHVCTITGNRVMVGGDCTKGVSVGAVHTTVVGNNIEVTGALAQGIDVRFSYCTVLGNMVRCGSVTSACIYVSSAANWVAVTGNVVYSTADLSGGGYLIDLDPTTDRAVDAVCCSVVGNTGVADAAGAGMGPDYDCRMGQAILPAPALHNGPLTVW